MTNVKIDENTRLEYTWGRETLAVTGWQWLSDDYHVMGEDEPSGWYITHEEKYSGYTLSEALCKSLIEMSVADDWDEAIPMIEEAGIPYETDED